MLGTLLHEAAHALAHVRGIKDTSRQGRWHNARFKTLAEELGISLPLGRHGLYEYATTMKRSDGLQRLSGRRNLDIGYLRGW